jgi:hypothetical protein
MFCLASKYTCPSLFTLPDGSILPTAEQASHCLFSLQSSALEAFRLSRPTFSHHARASKVHRRFLSGASELVDTWP